MTKAIERVELSLLVVEHGRMCEIYGVEFNRLTYAELGRRAATETAACGGALSDGTFRHRADRDSYGQAFDGAAPLLFVEGRAPAAHRRIGALGAGGDR